MSEAVVRRSGPEARSGPETSTIGREKPRGGVSRITKRRPTPAAVHTGSGHGRVQETRVRVEPTKLPSSAPQNSVS